MEMQTQFYGKTKSMVDADCHMFRVPLLAYPEHIYLLATRVNTESTNQINTEQ